MTTKDVNIMWRSNNLLKKIIIVNSQKEYFEKVITFKIKLLKKNMVFKK